MKAENLVSSHSASVCNDKLAREKTARSQAVPVHRFSLGGHLDILLRGFKHFPEGQRKAEIDFSKLGFFVTESQAEAQLELDLAQVKQQRAVFVCCSWRMDQWPLSLSQATGS